MTATAYWVGTVLVVDWTLTTPAGVPVTDATVVGEVRLPDGTTPAMTVAAVAAENLYRATYTPTVGGITLVWALSASGTAEGAVEGTVWVQPSTVGETVGDMLCQVADLGAILQLGSDVDASAATVLIEAATAVVQEATGGQRLVLVEDDEIDLLGDIGSWLELPQRPVQSIGSLTLDGETLVEGDDFERFGSRLWRACGWQPDRWTPSRVGGSYTHGYPAGDQGLKLGKSAVLSLVRGVYGNPEGALAIRIDDYSESYAKFSAALEATDYLAKALRRQYGRPFAAARLG
jgi:hypothetical protein